MLADAAADPQSAVLAMANGDDARLTAIAGARFGMSYLRSRDTRRLSA